MDTTSERIPQLTVGIDFDVTLKVEFFFPADTDPATARAEAAQMIREQLAEAFPAREFDGTLLWTVQERGVRTIVSGVTNPGD